MDHASISLREYLAERLDRQDRVLAEIHREARATNGRVNDLEKVVAVLGERSTAQAAEPPRRGKRDLAVGGTIGSGLAAFVWFLWEKLR